jgi:hypothetical protein
MPTRTIKDIPDDVIRMIAGLDPHNLMQTKQGFIELFQEVKAAMENDPALSLDALSEIKSGCNPVSQLLERAIVQLQKLGATDPTSFKRVEEEFLTKASEGYSDKAHRAILGVTSEKFRNSLFGYNDECQRESAITQRLLLAVAYGMESQEVNIPLEESHTAGLFKSHLFAKNLLAKSPEFLLTRADVTDWAGRTFNNVTAFEYAIWAKDFKMLAMMLACIPRTADGDEIRKALYLQYQKVKISVREGGGLKYTLKYERPNLNDHGIPDGTSVEVTEVRTENHFDFTLLIRAYEDYEAQFEERSLAQRDSFWVRIIGMLQHQLPVHILQRMCDSDQPFNSAIQSETPFKRSLFCTHWSQPDNRTSLFTTPLSIDSALYRGNTKAPQCKKGLAQEWSVDDKETIEKLSKVCSTEVEQLIEQQLSQAQHGSPTPP